MKRISKFLPGALSLLLAMGIIAGGMTLPRWLLSQQENALYTTETSVPQKTLSPYGSDLEALRSRLTLLNKLVGEAIASGDPSPYVNIRVPLNSELDQKTASKQALLFLETISSGVGEELIELSEYSLTEAHLYTSVENSAASLWYLYYDNQSGSSWEMILDPVSGLPLHFDFSLWRKENIDSTALWDSILNAYSSLYQISLTPVSEENSTALTDAKSADAEMTEGTSFYSYYEAINNSLELHLSYLQDYSYDAHYFYLRASFFF